jgi:hypothetical protein
MVTVLTEPVFQGAVDRVVVVTTNEATQPIDHITIKCKAVDVTTAYQSMAVTEASRAILYEEFRSAILRIGMLDAQMPKVPEGWTLRTTSVCNIFMYLLSEMLCQ